MVENNTLEAIIDKYDVFISEWGGFVGGVYELNSTVNRCVFRCLDSRKSDHC